MVPQARWGYFGLGRDFKPDQSFPPSHPSKSSLTPEAQTLDSQAPSQRTGPQCKASYYFSMSSCQKCIFCREWAGSGQSSHLTHFFPLRNLKSQPCSLLGGFLKGGGCWGGRGLGRGLGNVPAGLWWQQRW